MRHFWIVILHLNSVESCTVFLLKTSFIRAVTTHVLKLKSQHPDPWTCFAVWEGRIATQLPVQIQPYELYIAPFTQRRRINATAVVHQFSGIVHTERSTTEVKMNCCVIHTESRRCSSQRDMTVHVTSRVFSRWFPGFNLNPWIIYNHMNAVLTCRDWDPDQPNFLENDQVMIFPLITKLHNHQQ